MNSSRHEKFDDYPKDLNELEAPHSLDEQPPPPGDESETILQPQEQRKESDKETAPEETHKEFSELNGSSKNDMESRKEDRHHHHKKSRTKNYETSSDDKKVRDKKKRKKSREHEKKKSKKDRKSRSDKEKKISSKTGSVEKSPEVATSTELPEKIVPIDEKPFDRETSKEEAEKSHEVDDQPRTPEIEDEKVKDLQLKSSGERQSFRRSDSILDINPNVDLDLEEWVAPEVSKWERDENKSLQDASEGELGNGEVKKNPEEKVTSEIIKRAENAIFARAISAIRPVESKKSKTELDISPMSSSIKRSDNLKESKLQAFQVTVPASESGNRSVELKASESTRDSSKQRKTPPKTSIRNRLGVKVTEKKSRSRSKSRSPKRRLQSDCTKVSRSSRDRTGRSQVASARERHPTPDRRNKQLSSCIRIESKDSSTGSRSRLPERRRSRTPDDRRVVKRPRTSRSRSKSRHDALRRHEQRPNAEKNYVKPKEPSRSDEKSSRSNDQPSSSVLEKSKAKGAEAPIRKKSRDQSSSSSSSTASSSGSQKHSKRHSKHKVKKRSRSPSAESSSKRKKSKKEKKAKKKKKSSRK